MDLFGIGQAVSGIVGAGLGYAGTVKTNKTSEKIAQRQMDFQERMSSTAYQRAVLDMQKAGLNPMLAYQQGGASAPQGASYQPQNELGGAINGAVMGAQLASAIAQVGKTQQETELLEAQTENVEANTMPKSLQLLIRQEELSKLMADADLSREQRNQVLSAWRNLDAAELGIRADSSAKATHDRLTRATFDSDVKRRKAEADLTQLAIPEALERADFFKKAGDAPFWVKLLLQFMMSGSSARSALGR